MCGACGVYDAGEYSVEGADAILTRGAPCSSARSVCYVLLAETLFGATCEMGCEDVKCYGAVLSERA